MDHFGLFWDQIHCGIHQSLLCATQKFLVSAISEKAISWLTHKEQKCIGFPKQGDPDSGVIIGEEHVMFQNIHQNTKSLHHTNSENVRCSQIPVDTVRWQTLKSSEFWSDVWIQLHQQLQFTSVNLKIHLHLLLMTCLQTNKPW